jgi:hypothetical protein
MLNGEEDESILEIQSTPSVIKSNRHFKGTIDSIGSQAGRTLFSTSKGSSVVATREPAVGWEGASEGSIIRMVTEQKSSSHSRSADNKKKRRNLTAKKKFFS